MRDAESLEQGIELARSWVPTVILLDVRFPGSFATSLDLLPAFREACPLAEVIVMTQSHCDWDEERAIRLGAFGYVEKGDDDAICGMALGAQMLLTSHHVLGLH